MLSFFDHQPDEILIQIFKGLTFLERIKLKEVCKRFKKVVEKPELNLTEKEKLELPTIVIDEICNDGKYQCQEKDPLREVNVLKELLAKGSDPNMTDDADKSGKWPVPQIYKNDYKKRSILEMTAFAAKIHLVKLLIRKGANINYQDLEGYSALTMAILSGDPKIVKLLLENGADPNLKNSKDLTALEMAKAKMNYCEYPLQYKIIRIITALQMNSNLDDLSLSIQPAIPNLQRFHFRSL